MSRVYVYVRPILGSDAQDLAGQQDLGEAYYHRWLAPRGLEWGESLVDAADTRRLPFSDRPAGRKLMLQLLERGDHLVIDRLDRVCRGRLDAVRLFALLRNRGVYLHVVSIGMDTSTPAGAKTLRAMEAFAELDRASAAERTIDGIQTRKRTGKALNQYAGYGYRWAGRKGSRRRVPDQGEQTVLRQIVQWVEDGWTYERIYYHLRDRKVRTRTGKAWSLTRIKRAYQAAMLLRGEPVGVSRW